MELTQVEKACLLLLFNEGYRYLARDKDGSLYAYRFEPKLVNGYWDSGDDYFDKQKEELFSNIVLSSDKTACKIVCNASLDCYDLEEV